MLGDSHNFGQRVKRLGDVVVKPRCLVWEWLFLSRSSSFRNSLNKLANRVGTPSPLSAFPSLSFSSDDLNQLLVDGQVEYLTLNPSFNDEALTCTEAKSIGAAIAACAWFGLSDLHSENIAYGRTKSGELVWGPIDIESAFADFKLLNQTLLLPTRGIPHEVSGLAKVIEHLVQLGNVETVAHICVGYLDAFCFLNANSDEILDALAKTVDISTIPNRLIVRATRQYLSYLRAEDVILMPSLCDSEREQLERDDVPYFFQFIGQDDIYAFTSKDDFKAVALTPPLVAQSYQCAMEMEQRRPLRHNLSDLERYGVMQLLRALDQGLQADCEINSLMLRYRSNEIELHHAERLRLKVSRPDLKLETNVGR